MIRRLSTLHNVVTAADYAIAGLGRDGARLAMRALRAGWLTEAEAETLEPLAAAIAYLLGDDLPPYRGRDVRTVEITPAGGRDLAAAITEHMR